MIAGIALGCVLYATTVFPFVLMTGVDGDPWGGIFFCYGILCGLAGCGIAGRWAR
jgi:hypothetical protein